MKITFFTTTTFSDIQKTQSECIKKNFPDSDHLLIDGRGGWFNIWYKWIELAKNIESDWYVHIDEDCFITSNKDLLSHIDYMKENNIDISGPPDGHFEYRSGNHMALNSFFMIMNKKCIDTWINRKSVPQFRKEWIEEYPYQKKNHSHYEYNMEFGSSGKPLGLIWKPETEPYYDFILTIKENTEVFSFCDEFELKHSNLVLKYIV